MQRALHQAAGHNIWQQRNFVTKQQADEREYECELCARCARHGVGILKELLFHTSVVLYVWQYGIWQ